MSDILDKNCVVCKKDYNVNITKLASEEIIPKQEFEIINMKLAGFCSTECMKKWIPDNLKIDTKENRELVELIHKDLEELRKDTLVFDEDTTNMMTYVINRRLFSLFDENDRDYIVKLYYNSAKWHMIVSDSAIMYGLLYSKWNKSDKDLWLKSVNKYIESEMNLELFQKNNTEKDRKIIRSSIITHMCMFSAISLEGIFEKYNNNKK